ncbi:hypothetical protein ABQX22_13690 [Xanthomonas sp. WHRI 1810A]|uniref:hypothetical protein n=1 Tax=Xanthomonas sp. WHRI 1810A TaxID=3161565 RepID=UPI0032E870C2
MARSNSNDAAKPVVSDSTPVIATQPADAANGATGTVEGAQPLSAATSTTAGESVTAVAHAGVGQAAVPDAQANGLGDTGEITLYPLRSYLDGKEVRRAGGKGYKSPKHDAVSLIAADLATDKKPKS